jgi:putative ABC transport system permease protein
MHARDLLQIVWGDLERNLRRAVLTMFGLVVGSGAVVLVTSVGLAGRQYAVQQLETMGSNLVYAWYDGPTPSVDDLTEGDYDAVAARASALAEVSRLTTDYTDLNIRGEQYSATLVGTDAAYARVRNILMREGRFLSNSDVETRRRVCILPESLAERIFGNGEKLNRLLRVEDLDLQVIGTFRDVQSFGIPTELSQNAVIMPVSLLMAFSNSNRIDRIYAQAKSRLLVNRATRQISDILAANHGTDVIYRVGSLAEVLNVITRVSEGWIVIVTVVAGISLLVGGVGIMNIMLVTVRLRMAEIGLRKALGARSKEILHAFLLESLAISVAGGLAGILIGGSLPALLTTLLDVPIPISPLSVVLALVVSAGVGVLFGYYPARHASQLNPAQSMRYEA